MDTLKVDNNSVDNAQPRKKTKKRTIPKFTKVRDYCRFLINRNSDNSAKIIKLAKKKFPDSKVDGKHVSWYIWDMKKNRKSLKADFKLTK